MDCRPRPRRGWPSRAGALFAWPILLGQAANADDLIFKDGFDPTSPPGETCLAPVILMPDVSGEAESVTLALTAGVPVSLIVDGWHADESGPFSIIAQ